MALASPPSLSQDKAGNALPPIAQELSQLDWLNRETVAERPVSYWDASPLRAAAMVRPRTTEEVSMVLDACSRLGQSVILHGGRTNCVDSSRAAVDQVILSLEKMDRIVEIDPVGGIAVVEAGVILQALQEELRGHGLFLPLDIGARGSCTIGGNIATNAGGVNVLRYGMMRNLILGLEVVLADGTVLSSMNRMLKNNSGYDLKQLFIGTEGTLGVITKAVVRLEPVIARTGTILLAVPGFDGVTALLQSARRMLGSALQAFELMWGSYYDALTGPDGHSPPMERGSPYYVLVETALPASDETMLDDFLTSALEDGLVTDGVVAQSEAQRARIWKVRDDFDAILRSGDTYLFDVSLPIAHMHDYVDRVRDACHAVLPDAIVHVFGHIGDGNLHLFVTPRPGGTASKTDRKAVDECVYAPLGRYGGAISAEHGIGREKRDYLPISRTDAEIDLMRRMKRLLDPDLILNPGLVVKT